MSMPPELSMPVQRVLRTMISGVMLVQCFTVYVYLAAYIVLLYPVFLEERPTLVLPWLLLAAIRKFLCELTSLALGLGACLLLGPARPPCIKFVVFKVASITPAVYMWMLVLSYYNALKVASAFKTFPTVVTSSDHDCGLELAVRRRRTKSLQDEEQLRRKLVATFNYEARNPSVISEKKFLNSEISSRMVHSTDTSLENIKEDKLNPLATSMTSNRNIILEEGLYEDWCGNEVIVPRDTDRILEQFVIMMMRIGAYIKAEAPDPTKLFSSHTNAAPYNNMDCSTVPVENTDTLPLVGNTRGRTASYLQEYPQIFMKKHSDVLQFPEKNIATLQTVCSSNDKNTNLKTQLRTISLTFPETNNTAINVESGSKCRKTVDKRIPMKTLSNHSISPGKKKLNSLLKDTNVKDLKRELKTEKYYTDKNLYIKSVSNDSLQSLKEKNLSDKQHNNTFEELKRRQGKENKDKQNSADINTILQADKQTAEEAKKCLSSGSEISTHFPEHAILKQQYDAKSYDYKSESIDSLQRIIDRMKESLSSNTRSSKQDQNPTKTERPTSSRQMNSANSRINRKTDNKSTTNTPSKKPLVKSNRKNYNNDQNKKHK